VATWSLIKVMSWKGGLKQQGAHAIVGGENHVFGLAILGGGV
jgi:hypothetical protein